MATTFINRGHFFAPHVKPVLLDCNFVVAKTDAGGLGLINLKGQGIDAVFMGTSATPGKTLGYLNPNPSAGLIYVKLSDNYNRFYAMSATMEAPNTGSQLTATVAGSPFVITALGTATPAQWLAVGLPTGVTPAIGAAFIATATATIGGAATVQAPGASGIDHIEVIGNPNLTIAPSPLGGSPNVGGWIVLSCDLNATATAPADGTTICLTLYMSQSSVMVKGE